MGKYCSQCGNELNEDDRFCPSCGAKSGVEDNSPQQPVPSRRRTLSKKTLTALLSCLAILLISITVGLVFLQKKTSADTYIQDYAEAITEQNWEQAYTQAGFRNVDITEEEYVSLVSETYKNVKEYEIQQPETDRTDEEYMLRFMDAEGNCITEQKICLERLDSKQYVFFPMWRMDSESLFVKEASISIPVGAQCYLDGKELGQEHSSKENGVCEVTLPCLFVGTHTLKVTKKYYQDYETELELDAGTAKQGLQPITLAMKEEEKWREVYYQFLTAVQERDGDVLQNQFANVYPDVSFLMEEYSVDRPVKYALGYVNDDDMPELLIYVSEDTGLYLTYTDSGLQIIAPFLVMGQEVNIVWSPESGLPFMSYVERGNTIVWDFWGDQSRWNSVYQVNEDFTASVVDEVVLSPPVEVDTGELLSTINGKKVKDKKAEKRANANLKSCKMITFEGDIREDYSEVECVSIEQALDITEENLVNSLDYRE